jgi:hypothetical protein
MRTPALKEENRQKELIYQETLDNNLSFSSAKKAKPFLSFFLPIPMLSLVFQFVNKAGNDQILHSKHPNFLILC